MLLALFWLTIWDALLFSCIENSSQEERKWNCYFQEESSGLSECPRSKRKKIVRSFLAQVTCVTKVENFPHSVFGKLINLKRTPRACNTFGSIVNHTKIITPRGKITQSQDKSKQECGNETTEASPSAKVLIAMRTVVGWRPAIRTNQPETKYQVQTGSKVLGLSLPLSIINAE